MNTIPRTELQELLASGKRAILIDVNTPEEFEAAHIAGAKNCCVFEVNFLDHVAAAAPDKGGVIVVCGSSGHSLASSTAQEKLARAGYTAVRDYRGGIADWIEAGLPVERGPQVPGPAAPRVGRHEVDPAKSHVHWTGRNINGAHTGSVGIKSGWIDVAPGPVASGEVTLDMESIADSDLADSALNRMLIAHLMSDDFFDTASHPTAVFQLRHVTFNPHARPGAINADVDGVLTLKGVTREIGYPALIEVLPGGSISAEAHFDIDRTHWNVIYGSGKFYERLGRHLVHDHISLALRIVTR